MYRELELRQLKGLSEMAMPIDLKHADPDPEGGWVRLG
jgi:hypothetical protein